jgi:hypothetical protein
MVAGEKKVITEEIDKKLRKHFFNISSELDEVSQFIPFENNLISEAWRNVNFSIACFAKAMMQELEKLEKLND